MEMKAYKKLQAQLRFISDYADRIKSLETEVKSLKEQVSKK